MRAASMLFLTSNSAKSIDFKIIKCTLVIVAGGGGGEKFSGFSGRIQSIGRALAWVTIARDSESEPQFYPVRQFRRICAGH